jgi:DNA-binding NtrC family response regulator
MITGYGTIDSAIESLKLGAIDYLQKPITFEKILQIISEYSERNSRNRDNHLFIQTAKSRAMEQIVQKTGKLAKTTLPVLILGENGTGKEVVADYIVSLSQTKDQPFIKVNSSAFSETLLDNELFGHEKGAYTGATVSFKGVFEQADGGTLFLDEIGDMPLSIQAKILRALQNNEIRRLGSEKTTRIHTRFIAATNKDIQAMIDAGTFRKDLYYRLNTAMIQLPPLRERREDIEGIVQEILSGLGGSCDADTLTLDAEVFDLFMQYPWPGNIRELCNCLYYASAISTGTSITLDDLPGTMIQPRKPVADLTSLEASEHGTILKELEKAGFNISKAASALGISRSTLYQKIKKYGIVIEQ